jgi:hypothetical protein
MLLSNSSVNHSALRRRDDAIGRLRFQNGVFVVPAAPELEIIFVLGVSRLRYPLWSSETQSLQARHGELRLSFQRNPTRFHRIIERLLHPLRADAVFVIRSFSEPDLVFPFL